MNQISFFQFDNLVKNRVPFCLLNFSEPIIAGLYSGIYKMHLENIEVPCTVEAYKQVVEEKKFPKDFPIVLVCKEGKDSEKIQQDLEKQGFGNVFWFEGGVEEMQLVKSNAN